MPRNPIRHRPAKSWLKISITVDSRQTDAIAAYLTNLTGSGLEITPLETGLPEADLSFFTEKISAYILIEPEGADEKTASAKVEELGHFLAKVGKIFPDCPAPRLQTETIAEEDWGEKWKSFFTSFQITPTLTIKPSWEDAEKEDQNEGGAKAVIDMDPGLAFGTGHHASTQLAVLLLEELFQNSATCPEKVLDLGTGSGILAMACALFGANEVLALDNDPDAVATARQNISKNRLEERVSVSGGDVAALTAGFDIIVANITHDVLAELANRLAGLLHPDGFLVLSGILRGDQENSIRGIYAAQGLACMKSLAQDEWAALLFQKKD